jgi:ABC-type branched-subunit amino acid transport system substrate-binding protein
MTRRTTRIAAVLAAASLIAAACGDDDDDDATTDTPGTTAADGTEAPGTTATDGTEAPGTSAATDTTEATDETDAPGTTEGEGDDGGGEGWTVSTDDCVDPDAANEPIEGTVQIAAAMPLSGGPAAAAFAPVAAGFQAYIDYANENELVPGYELAITIGDDQYNPATTPNVVNGALDAGAHLFSGIIGTPNNEAVRDLLNEECVPQLMALTGSPAWGEVEDYPWTTGALLPYNVETEMYITDIVGEFPDGATAAVFYTNNDFGQIYNETFEELAGDNNIEIVDTQTIEAPETAPPQAQVSSIAGNAPDVIMAAPLGAQCATFAGELVNAMAANAGWEPRVYITNTCASPLILAVSGPAANGLISSSNQGLKDIGNPEIADADPEIVIYKDYMESRGEGDTIPTSAAGWTTGEVTVAILAQAAESPDGLTKASIINAARNFEYTPSMGRDGVVFKMNGEEDAFLVESTQIVQYDAANAIFNDVGELITEFESS